MYCLDTNVIVDILRGDLSLKAKVENLNSELFITPITLCELFQGAYGHVNSEEKIRGLEIFLLSCNLLEFDAFSCKEFGNLYSKLKKSGKLIDEFDLIIAAIVKSNDLILVTRDRKDFVNTGIKLEIW